jgi:predicted RNase H-like nuclease (RuvC/YqgF family)
MREITGYKDTIVDLQKQLTEEKEYVKQLEEMLPKTAKKKLGIAISETPVKEEDKEEENSPSLVDNNVKSESIVSTGGTF